MNLRSFEERTTRSKSPKRYSLNRKIKEKERKQMADFAQVGKQTSPPASFRQNVESGRCVEKLASYEIQKRDHSVAENGTAASEVQVSQDIKVWFNSPVAEKKKCPPFCTSSNIKTQHSALVSQKPGVSTNPMMPCSPGDFRSIANQLKINPPRRPENRLYSHVTHTNCNPGYAQHYGNIQGIQGLQPRGPLHNGVNRTTMTHSVMLRNLPQEIPFVPSYMTPNQGAGFQFGHIGMQRNSEAYNAFTAYGNPFGIFWNQQN